MKRRSVVGRGAVAPILLLATMLAVGLGCSGPPSRGERNGRSDDGLITHNGFSENGFSENGLTQNGFSENGFSENGFSENGFSENGFSENGFSENGFSENGLSPMQILESDPNAVDFVRYAYSCAMPPGKHMTLTINGKAVTFDGSLGLAPEWGEDDGSCNDTCKRWISACLLARTNAYGAHVAISLRAPRALFLANGDMDAYQRTQYLELQTDAVDPTLDEPTLFPLREGAYFGNIFASQLAGDGTLVNAPKYYACAGPGSNIPQLTNRFCSSQGDGCLIYTGDGNSTTVNPQPPTFGWQTCTDAQPACAGVDAAPNQAVHDCTGADGAAYKEVLTIYLKRPITVCGNHICEGAVPGAVYDSTSLPEDSTTCPDDCHPGTWAKSVDLRCTLRGSCYGAGPTGQIADLGRRIGVAPDDTVIRGLDFIPGSSGNIDFGAASGLVPPDNKSLLVAYRPDGTPLLSQRLVIDPALSAIDPALATRLRAVVADKDGNIVVAASSPLWVAKLDPTGATLWINDFPNINDGIASAVIADVAGSVIVAYDPQTVGAPSFPTIAKLHANTGDFVWEVTLDPVDTNINLSNGKLSSNGSGVVHFTDDGNVYRVSAGGVQLFARGAFEFGNKLRFTSVTTDQSGQAYVAGSCESANFFGADGGAGFIGPGSFVVKFTQNGDVDPAFAPYFQAGQVFPVDLHLDSEGNIIVAGGFFGDGTAPNFGAEPFNSWGSPDTFIAARSSSDGSFLWAKQLTLVTAGGLDALGVGHAGQVFVSGGFDGSMLLDGQQLINSDPGAVGNQNLFVGSFNAPCSTPGCDVVAPVVDPGSVPGPSSMIGHPIVVYATSRLGATVFYTPPTARNAPGDTQFNGVSINCLPASGATFPIGVTTVACNATDPHRNTSSVTFPITVLGTAGPVILNLPRGQTVNATGAGGAVLTYQVPTATDQIDGPVPVTCNPPSGSLFPVGTTTVDCSAADLADPPNVTHAKFKVVVKIVGPPSITVPNPGPIVEATSTAGAVVTYAASAQDAVGNPIPVTCVPPSGSQFAFGMTTVNCSARDAGGNQATASFTVQVRYAWFGLLSPIKNTGTSVFNLGSTIPVKFQLSAGINNAVANLTLAKITNGIAGPEQNAVSSGNSNQGNLFRYDASGLQYIFNLSTKPLSTGVWRLRIDLHDGATHTVNITLR